MTNLDNETENESHPATDDGSRPPGYCLISDVDSTDSQQDAGIQNTPSTAASAHAGVPDGPPEFTDTTNSIEHEELLSELATTIGRLRNATRLTSAASASIRANMLNRPSKSTDVPNSIEDSEDLLSALKTSTDRPYEASRPTNGSDSAHTQLEADVRNTPSSAASTHTDVRECPPQFTDMTDSIELGEEVLSALATAVDRLYEANHATTMAVPILLPKKRWFRRRGYGSGDPAPPSDSRDLFRARVQRMTTSEAAGYACCLDLVMVLSVFADIIGRLPEDDEDNGKQEGQNGQNGRPYQTLAIAADVLIAGYRQWTRCRAQIERAGKDGDSSYARILSTFNIYVTQCKTQRKLESARLPPAFKEVIHSSRQLSDCLDVVRTHASLHVSQVWADVAESVLPQVVRACTLRYRPAGSRDLATTFVYHVERLLEARMWGAGHMMTAMEKEPLPTKVPTMAGLDLSELEYTDPWAAFVLQKHGKEKVVQSGGYEPEQTEA